jgi:hypothetical protein
MWSTVHACLLCSTSLYWSSKWQVVLPCFTVLLDVTVGGWAFFTRLHKSSGCWGVEEHRAECQIVPWKVSAWPQVWAVATSHCQQWAETPNPFFPFCHVTASLPSQHGKWFIFVFRNVSWDPWFQVQGGESIKSTTSWVLLAHKCWGIGLFSGIVKDASCSITLVQWVHGKHKVLYHISPVGPWKTQGAVSH